MSSNGGNDGDVYVVENTGSIWEAAWTLRGSLEWVGLDTTKTDFNAFVSLSQMVDLDLDGMKDLVYFSRFNGLEIWHRIKISGPERFVQRKMWSLDNEKFAMQIAPAAVDLNGDGKQDLVVGSQGPGLVYYQSKGLSQNGTGVEYQEKITLLDQDGSALDDGNCGGNSCSRPAFIDIGNDNDFDLILGTCAEGLWYYENIGTPTNYTFVRRVDWVLKDACNVAGCWVSAGHFDDDKLMDLAVGNSVETWKVKLYKQTTGSEENATLNFAYQPTWGDYNLGVHHYGGVTFGDLDGDGDDDAITGGQLGKVRYYERTGTLTPPKWSSVAEWSLASADVGGYARPTLLDYNNNGILDLIVGNNQGQLSLFENSLCGASCTSSGRCDTSGPMPKCKCVFQGASSSSITCNTCTKGYFFALNDPLDAIEITAAKDGNCRSCPSGTLGTFDRTRKNKEETCAECPVGRYQPEEGGVSCIACPAGWIQKDEGKPFCLPCNAGLYQSVVGQPSCTECLPGNYTDASNMDACKQCPLGYAQLSEKQTSCVPCFKGEYNDIKSAATCKQCPIDYFTNTTKSTSCNLCPPGKGATQVGTVHCSECEAGRYSDSTEKCNDCVSGQFRGVGSNPLSCEHCPAGYYQLDNRSSLCLPCLPGTAETSTGQPSCSQCEVNYFADVQKLVECKPCGSGTSTKNKTGSTSCSPCGAGEYGDDCASCAVGQYRERDDPTFTSCRDCHQGYYQDQTSQASCLPCIPGQFQDREGNESCIKCASGHKFHATAGSVAVGISASNCLACDKGQHQPKEGSTFCLPCLTGTFQNVTGSSLCNDCPIGFSNGETEKESCTSCPKGTFQDAIQEANCKGMLSFSWNDGSVLELVQNLIITLVFFIRKPLLLFLFLSL